MKMKFWKQILIFGCTAVLFAGCGENQKGELQQEKKEGIAGVVQELYASDYEFQKTEIRYMDLLDEKGEVTGEQGLVKTVYEGKTCGSPLESYMKVVEQSQESAWEERYVLESKDKVQMTTKTKEGEIFSQELGTGFEYAWRYPYGYGKELEFKKIREETVDGVLCDVYETQYRETVPVDEKETLEAAVYQEYFIDREKQQVVMIYTDLQDLYDKKAAVSCHFRQDVSVKKAVEQTKGKAEGASDQFRILNYNGDIDIEPIQ